MPGRRLGQHFLTGKPILQRIAGAVCPDASDRTVIEIGPGKGALTEFLLQRAKHLIAVEVDQVLVHYLQRRFRDAGHLSVINADILKTDLTQWGQITVAGNLPYYITSPILEKVLSLGSLLERAVFLMQKEVALRLAAQPGSRDYGFLSVQTQLYAEPKILFDVAPGSFQPPPKVDSSVVLLVPRNEPLVPDPGPFMQFVSLCFRQKRKTLRNNLLGAYDKALIDALPEAGMRAEQLSIDQFNQVHQRILRV
jgi:16S rRNA (adenine1518-N6/adenine1519-N6)-dimethyltransferase